MDLAKTAGIGYDRYWRIEKGYIESTADERTAIADALGCVVADIAFPLVPGHSDESAASTEAGPRETSGEIRREESVQS